MSAKRHIRNEQFSNIHAHSLQELDVGDTLKLQTQVGSYLRCYYKTVGLWNLWGTDYVRINDINLVMVRDHLFLHRLLPVTDTAYYPKTEAVSSYSSQPDQRQHSECGPSTSESVPGNETSNIFWNFEIQTDHSLQIRKPELVLIYKKRICRLFAVLADHRLEIKAKNWINT